MMKSLIRVIRNKSMRIIQRLNNKNGFVGILLVIIVSIAIFTVLSSVHIYTIKQAKYQGQIREAFVMQTEMENFAIRIIDGYNRGRLLSTCSSPCCPLGTVNFDINLKTGCGANPTSNKQEDYECLTSSSKQRYCLVKLEEAGKTGSVLTNDAPTSPIATGTTMSSANSSNAETDMKTACGCTKSGSLPTYNITNQSSATCQTKCGRIMAEINNNEHAPAHDINQWAKGCCEQFQAPVINCNSKIASTCDDYESNGSLSHTDKMFCEICEQDDGSAATKPRLFTYYVCPVPLNNCISNLKASNPEDKAKSGVFYQTFRLLTH